MLVACPSCATEYDIPEDRLSAGRAVQCARCGGRWTPIEAPPPPAAMEDVSAPNAEPEPKAAEPVTPMAVRTTPTKPTGDRLLLVAWAGSILILLASGYAAIAWRDDITRLWPPSARLYATFGPRS